MPGSYYYRPIDPGYAALGAGLAAGVDQGASAYFREREMGRAQKEQKAREMRGWQEFLIGQEGGLGETPTEATDIRGATGPGRALMPRQGPDSIPGQRDGLLPSSVRMPDLPGMGPRRDVPGYVGIGEGEFKGYVKTPEARAQEAHARDVGWATEENAAAFATEQERARIIAAALGSAGATLAANWGDPSAPGFAEAATKWWEYGKDPSEFYTPRPPIRGSKEALAIIEAEQDVYDRHQNGPPVPTDRGLPTAPQAYERLKEQYSEYTADESGKPVWKGFSKTLKEIWAEAQAEARGEAPPTRAPGRESREPKYPWIAKGRPPAPLLLDPGADEEAAPAAAGGVALDSPPTAQEAKDAMAALPNATSPDEWRQWIADQRAGRR